MNKNVLVIALSGIGDALMFTPALQLLKKHFPSVKIDALVMFKGVVDIYERTGLFDKIHHFDYLNGGKLAALKFTLGLRGNYDHSINVYPSNRKEYSLISVLIGAKKRGAIEYNRMDKGEFGFLNNVRIKENDTLHNCEENILLVKKLFSIEDEIKPDLLFNLDEVDLNTANNFLLQNSITGKDLVIGIHAGCSTLKNHFRRRWEPEKFAALGKRLIEKHQAKIFIFGGPDEKDLKANIFSLINHSSAFIVEIENLSQSAALIKRCNLFVTNDSSLMHVAAAMKRNVVAIIGPTNTNFIYPWNTNYKIASLHLDCSPCFYYSPKPLTCNRTDLKFKCIKELDVDLVYKLAKDFL